MDRSKSGNFTHWILWVCVIWQLVDVKTVFLHMSHRCSTHYGEHSQTQPERQLLLLQLQIWAHLFKWMADREDGIIIHVSGHLNNIKPIFTRVTTMWVLPCLTLFSLPYSSIPGPDLHEIHQELKALLPASEWRHNGHRFAASGFYLYILF